METFSTVCSALYSHSISTNLVVINENIYKEIMFIRTHYVKVVLPSLKNTRCDHCNGNIKLCYTVQQTMRTLETINSTHKDTKTD